MEEKIVGKKRKGSSLSFHISFTLLSIASLSSVFIYSAPALVLPPHSGSPTIIISAHLISYNACLCLGAVITLDSMLRDREC